MKIARGGKLRHPRLGSPLPTGVVIHDAAHPENRRTPKRIATAQGWVFLDTPKGLRPRSASALLYRAALLEHLRACQFTVLDSRYTLIEAHDPQGIPTLVWGEVDLKLDTIKKRLPKLLERTLIAHPNPEKLAGILKNYPWVAVLSFGAEQYSALLQTKQRPIKSL